MLQFCFLVLILLSEKIANRSCSVLANIYNVCSRADLSFEPRPNQEQRDNEETLNKMKKLLIILFGLWALCFSQESKAQDWALKSNLLYDATTTINFGVERALAEKWTLDVSGNWNPFQFADNKKWKHWLVQPEVRYWTCRKFGGHFFALNLSGGQYNMGNIDSLPKFLGTDFSQLADHRFEGWFAGAGVGYGYAWMLGKHWNLEAEIGVGYAYSDYTKYYCPKCGEKIGRESFNYFGLTKAAISLVYLF